MSRSRRRSKKKAGWDLLPPTELHGKRYCDQMIAYIAARKGQFFIDDNGETHVVVDGRRVHLSCDRNNAEVASLIIDACGVTPVSAAAQAALIRLRDHAKQTGKRVRLMRFSALDQRKRALYLPLAHGKLLRIEATGTTTMLNGEDAGLWVEHPENDAFVYGEAVNVKEALAEFEELAVETQATADPEMHWFVALAEGLFPYIRDCCPARFIVVHEGPSQSGKTSGAQRFTLLHGLGPVKGDYSVAALGNSPDLGLLVMDNREHANIKREFIDYCLFLATGATRGRSNSEGVVRSSSATRPVGVITTIEGVYKDELKNRTVRVRYERKAHTLKRATIEQEILNRRNDILSAFVEVIRVYLARRNDPLDIPNPIPEFEEHFTEIARLLYAYAEVTGRDPKWAAQIIERWAALIRTEKDSDASSEFEQPILRTLEESHENFDVRQIEWEGRHGTLYMTQCGKLLTLLEKQNRRDLSLPKDAGALSRRLRSDKFESFRVLTPDIAPDVPELRRTGDKRPIGFFVEDSHSPRLRTAA